jgi:DNA-binding response OmpR family regulator
LDESIIDTARDYKSASKKIKKGKYDLAILDIMGVNGLQLLEMSVKRRIPAVMLTAHAVKPEVLMESVKKGAISYLPKAKLADLDELLCEILDAFNRNESTWGLLLERLWDYFNKRWGPGWQESNQEFWSEFCVTCSIGKEMQERLLV